MVVFALHSEEMGVYHKKYVLLVEKRRVYFTKKSFATERMLFRKNCALHTQVKHTICREKSVFFKKESFHHTEDRIWFAE